jgi:hypothetical protein
LKEQIIFRDELIDEARKIIQSGGMKRQIEDFRIIDIKDILFENKVYI